MPSNRVHCAISMKRTGKTYQELHSVIDDNKEDRTANHRSKNHYYTNELKDYIYKRFSRAETVSEWLFHIALDNLDTYITNEWNYNKNTFNFIKFGFADNDFIHCEEEELDEEEMAEEFSDD